MGSLLSGNDLEPEPLIDGLEDSSKKPPLLRPLIRGNGGPDLDLVGAPVPRVAVAEAKRQLILGAPIAGMNVLNFMMQLVSIIFVGHLGALPLAGAAMSASLSNVTGFAVLVGTCPLSWWWLCGRTALLPIPLHPCIRAFVYTCS